MFSSVVLDRITAAKGLANVGVNADGLRHSFLSLSIPSQKLTNIDLVASYRDLQDVDASNNCLTSLRPFSALPHLLKVNAVGNRLVEVLDFDGPRRLSDANLAKNSIAQIRDLVSHRYLKRLILDDNDINTIEGLQALECLEVLSICNNNIESLTGLSKCVALKELRLSGNKISSIEYIEDLASLRVIDLRCNNIQSLQGLEQHPVLSEVDIGNNVVNDLDETRYLCGLACLRTLSLDGNPVQLCAGYRHIVTYRLLWLTMLDGADISAEDKVNAANFHGEDREVQRHIRAKYFPNGELTFWPRTNLDEEIPSKVAGASNTSVWLPCDGSKLLDPALPSAAFEDDLQRTPNATDDRHGPRLAKQPRTVSFSAIRAAAAAAQSPTRLMSVSEAPNGEEDVVQSPPSSNQDQDGSQEVQAAAAAQEGSEVGSDGQAASTDRATEVSGMLSSARGGGGAKGMGVTKQELLLCDRYALRAPDTVASSISDLAEYISAVTSIFADFSLPLAVTIGTSANPDGTNSEDRSWHAADGRRDTLRARALFRWITARITFDCDAAFRSAPLSDVDEATAVEVLRRRRAVAEGYANLFQAVALGMGLRAAVIQGMGKGPLYLVGQAFGSPNHVWNAVLIGRKWKLVDCAWGAGTLSRDGRTTFIPKFEDHYFFTNPRQFVADHLPSAPHWQLLTDSHHPAPAGSPPASASASSEPEPSTLTLSLPEFTQRPLLRPHFFAHRLGLVSHKECMVACGVQSLSTLSIEVPKGVSVAASMVATSTSTQSVPSTARGDSPSQSGSGSNTHRTGSGAGSSMLTELDLTLVSRDGLHTEVNVVCPHPGHYVLTVSSMLLDRFGGRHEAAVQYLVVASSNLDMVVDNPKRLLAFPKQLEAFGNHDVCLFSPIEGNLSSGSIHFFSIRVPEAESVTCLDAVGEWHNLTQVEGGMPVGRFDGRIKVNGFGRLIIYAKYPNSRLNTPLLQYCVVPKPPPVPVPPRSSLATTTKPPLPPTTQAG